MLTLSLFESLFGIGKLYKLNILEVCCRTCLIDKVNGLIRKVSVSDVSLGCLNGKLDYFIRICDIVMLLVVILDTL